MHVPWLPTRGSARTAFALAVGLAAAACSDSSTATTPPLYDSRLIAFASDSDNAQNPTQGNDGRSIFVMHADGTHKSRLTAAHFQDNNPRWSPDGTSIAFETNRAPAGIWIMNADGSGQRPLLSAPGFDSPTDFHWSPDGKSIAFVTFPAGSAVIMIANADGSHAHQLPLTQPGDRWPSWSPDGSRIAFMGVADSVGYSIFVENSDGTARGRLTFGADLEPEWSPEGTRIAYIEFSLTIPSQIFVMNADGSGQQALGSEGQPFDPAWSPDGHQLAYDRNTFDSTSTASDGPVEIFRMDANGSEAREITSFGHTFASFFQAWSPTWKPTP
jgi:Tol biopolymer transport system component